MNFETVHPSSEISLIKSQTKPEPFYLNPQRKMLTLLVFHCWAGLTVAGLYTMSTRRPQGRFSSLSCACWQTFGKASLSHPYQKGQQDHSLCRGGVKTQKANLTDMGREACERNSHTHPSITEPPAGREGTVHVIPFWLLYPPAGRG